MIYSTVRNLEASFEYICITRPKKHINMGHANKKTYTPRFSICLSNHSYIQEIKVVLQADSLWTTFISYDNHFNNGTS